MLSGAPAVHGCALRAVQGARAQVRQPRRQARHHLRFTLGFGVLWFIILIVYAFYKINRLTIIISKIFRSAKTS